MTIFDQTSSHSECAREVAVASESGWALLGLLLALAILGVALLEVVPSIQTQMRREREAEMIYRGNQMAEGIARYYNRGVSAAIQVNVPPPYGYLLELKRLRDGITVGINQIKFVRPSALVDPMSNDEWQPVRIRDPRLYPVLQAYAAANQVIIPPNYLIMASPPTRVNLGDSQSEGGFSGSGGSGSGFGGSGSGLQPPQREGMPSEGGGAGGQGRLGGTRNPSRNNDPDDLDNDDDPLGHLLDSQNSGLPIVGVAPKAKGPSLKTLWGLQNYEEWVFIYIPPTTQFRTPPNVQNQPNQPNQPSGPGGKFN